MIKYDKLVRDKIPEIIADNGKKATFSVAGLGEYIQYLEKKLDEEIAEYHESRSVEELVDIYEVVLALAYNAHGMRHGDFSDKCKEKILKRGGFSRRIILIESEE